jgi:hypothetical protein
MGNRLPSKLMETRNLLAERDLAKMLLAHTELKPYLYGDRKQPPWRALPLPRGSGLRVILMPNGPNHVMTREELIRDEARLMFLHFLLHPLREKLCETPCARCDRYYVKKTVRQKVYCSRRCSRDGTAAFATKNRLKEERDQKLSIAGEEAKNWISARTDRDWKTWVSNRKSAKKLGITPKFLTRAVNNSELDTPRKLASDADLRVQPKLNTKR